MAYLHDFLHDKLVCCADIVFLLFVQDKLPPLDTVMDFSPLRFPSRLIRAFGLSFMGSLVLLNVQQQQQKAEEEEEAFLGCAPSSEPPPPPRSGHTGVVSSASANPEVGDSPGLSHPVRTETVNTAAPPALLSGTNAGGRGRGCAARGEDSPLSTLQFPRSSSKKENLSSRLSAWRDVHQVLRIQLLPLLLFSHACNLPVPVICSGCKSVSQPSPIPTERIKNISFMSSQRELKLCALTEGIWIHSARHFFART